MYQILFSSLLHSHPKRQLLNRKIKEDLEVVHWDDVTVSYLINKLKRGYITEEGVIKLEYYLRHNRELVVF